MNFTLSSRNCFVQTEEERSSNVGNLLTSIFLKFSNYNNGRNKWFSRLLVFLIFSFYEYNNILHKSGSGVLLITQRRFSSCNTIFIMFHNSRSKRPAYYNVSVFRITAKTKIFLFLFLFLRSCKDQKEIVAILGTVGCQNFRFVTPPPRCCWFPCLESSIGWKNRSHHCGYPRPTEILLRR